MLEGANVVLLLTISLIANLIGCIVKTYFSNSVSENTSDYYLYNAVSSIVSAIVLAVWGGIQSFSAFSLILGVAFGVITVFQQITNLKALKRGPLSYTSVIISLSTIIPALSGMMFWKETIGFSQCIGIILMCLCFIFSIDTNKDTKRASAQWFIYCVVAFVCTGLIGVMQKYHQNSDYRSELNFFLVVAFAISFVYSMLAYFIRKKKNNIKTWVPKPWISTTIFIVSGISAAANNKLNLYLSGVMDSAVFFPIVNGGGLVLTAVAAILMFHEKLSFKRWLGLLVGILSVIFLCNPFS